MTFQLLPGGIADDNPCPVLLVQRFQPGTEVHRVTDDGVAHDRVRPDVAGNHRSAVDADADIELRLPVRLPARVEPRQVGHHVERRLHRVIGVVGVVEGRTEQRHHHVADELIERSLVQEHDVDHAREILVQRPDDDLRLALLGEGGESAHIREKHGHLATLTAEPRPCRVGHQLTVDVLRHVATEELRDLALLTPLDEVLVGHAAEKRDRRAEQRLGQWQPRAAREPEDRRPDIHAGEREGRQHRPPGRQVGGGQPDSHGQRDDDEDAGRPRHPRQRPPRQQVVGDCRVDLDSRHPATLERCLEHVEKARGGRADEDDLVLEDRRIDRRRLAGEDLFLRVQQIVERVAAVRAALHVVEQCRTAEYDRPPVERLQAVGRPRADRGQRDRLAGNRQPAVTHRHLVAGHAGRLQRRRQSQRWQRHGLRAADERDGVAQRAVGIEGEVVVSEAGGGCRQLRVGQQERLALEQSGAGERVAGRRQRRRIRLFAVEGRVGEQQDVAARLHGVGERLIRFGTRQRRRSHREAGAGVGGAEGHVVGDDLRRCAGQEIDEAGVDDARPRPAAGNPFEILQRVFVDLDERDVRPRRLRPGGRRQPPVVGLELERLVGAEGGRIAKQGERDVEDQDDRDRRQADHRSGDGAAVHTVNPTPSTASRVAGKMRRAASSIPCSSRSVLPGL